MRKFAHSVGPFKYLKGQENKRANFLRKLVDVIRSNVLYGAACMVEHEAFEKVDKIHHLSELAGVPYSLAGRDCVAHMNIWLGKERRELPISYYFEDGDPGKGELMRIMRRDALTTPVFRPGVGSDGSARLQAADFAAYELLKAHPLGEDLPLHKYRRSLIELASIKAWWGRYTDQDLLALCQKARVPLRT